MNLVHSECSEMMQIPCFIFTLRRRRKSYVEPREWNAAVAAVEFSIWGKIIFKIHRRSVQRAHRPIREQNWNDWSSQKIWTWESFARWLNPGRGGVCQLPLRITIQPERGPEHNYNWEKVPCHKRYEKTLKWRYKMLLEEKLPDETVYSPKRSR